MNMEFTIFSNWESICTFEALMAILVHHITIFCTYNNSGNMILLKQKKEIYCVVFKI